MMDLNNLYTWLGISALGVYMHIEPYNIKLNSFDLYFDNLPDEFDGFKILHLSDLHTNKFGLLEKKLCKILQSYETDICFITGDVIKHKNASEAFAKICDSIKCKRPIYAVQGNSEHKPWVKTDEMLDAICIDGVKVLTNSSDFIEKNGKKIIIAGVDDPFSNLDDVSKAFREVDPNNFIIFMTHCPSTTPDAINLGANLILSGHTHGGQVRIPFINNFWTHMHRNKKLNDGLYLPEDLTKILHKKIDNVCLYVNRGIGTSRIHIRFFCKPEISSFTLHKSNS